ncbi:NACHT domain-containing protein [Actinoplanes sp. NPDC051851]|uniref:NACHT domain-containing protein n=1 Tax=Actinoplanes sp. NPDC051851 TaxID=3154753 RepID=UPI0034161D45
MQTTFAAVAAVLVVTAVAILAGGDPVDMMDKLASIGSLALAAAAAAMARREAPDPPRAVSRWLPRRHRHEYLRWVIARNRDVDIRGLGTQGPFSLEVEDVYVDVSLIPRPLHETSGDPLAEVGDGESVERREVGSFLAEWPPRTLAIVGPPGGGKTTLLRHLTLALADRRPPNRALRKRIPVLLAVREKAQAIAEDADLPLAAVLPSESPGSAAWFDRQLANGRCLIMLDGLDEVADPAQRRLVAEWVERQIALHHTNGFVITSRPYGYQSSPLAAADVLQVRPFTGEQIERFILRWYAATEVRWTGRRDEAVLAGARRSGEDLLRRLRENLPLYDLAMNPLLLTMIAHVHRYRGVLPGGRAELYREISRVFLGSRDAAKGIGGGLSVDQRESVLKHLALEMMKARTGQVEAVTAARLISDRVARVAPDTRPEAFMVEIEQKCGLLVERETGVYAFAHLTFQEYLAAVWLRERGGDGFLAEHTDDQWWREVTLLYCADADAGPIVEACLKEDTARALLLASDCAEVARELDPLIRSRLDGVLSAEAHSADATRALVVGQVLLVRKLRRRRHRDDGVVVAGDPITNAEFALFLRATGNDAHRPAWWTETLAARRPGRPVMGLTPAEQRGFCSWAGSASDGSYEPGPDEDGGDGLRTAVPEDGMLRALGLVFMSMLRDAVETRELLDPKLMYLARLARVTLMADVFLPVVPQISDRLIAEPRFVAADDVTAAFYDLDAKLTLATHSRAELALLRQFHGNWLDWTDRSDRGADDVVPIVVGALRLAVRMVEKPSMLAEAVSILDRAIMLHWQAGGILTPGNKLWLRRT